MSRTDSTDPLSVRIWHSDCRTAVHDHSAGPCDLPEHPLGDGSGEPTRCRWDMAWRPRTVCFCLHQHQAWWRHEEIRRQRHRTRALLREALRSANAGDGDVDVPVLAVRR